MRPKVAASLVVLGIALLPACSAASKAGTATSPTSTQQTTGGSISTRVGNHRARIRVTPGSGHGRTRFVVAFTAPQATETVSGATRRYEVGANTPPRQGCVPSATKLVGASHAGARVSAALTPIGGHWCTGTYRGRIIETVMPRCEPGKLCPAYMGYLHQVGTFKFRVS